MRPESHSGPLRTGLTAGGGGGVHRNSATPHFAPLVTEESMLHP